MQRSTIWRWRWRVSVSWRHSLCRAQDHERKCPEVHKCCRYAQARLESGAVVDWKNTRAPLSLTDWPAAGWTSSRKTLCQLSSWQSSADRNRRFECRRHRHGKQLVTLDQLQQVGDVQQEDWSLRDSMHYRRSGWRGGHCSHVLDTSTEVQNKPLNHDAVKTARRL